MCRVPLATVVLISSFASVVFTVASSDRHLRRKLPGSKGGTGSGSSSQNCVGSWGSWGACSGGKSKRSYTVSQYQSGGGSACPHSAGAQEEKSCSNCIGSWSEWSACANSQKSRTYTVSTPSSGGGSSCPYSNGHSETQSCTVPVHCAGSWSSWSVCNVGQANKTRNFNITTEAANGGMPCPEEGKTESAPCDTSKIVPLTWQAENGHKDLALVMCPKGSAFSTLSHTCPTPQYVAYSSLKCLISSIISRLRSIFLAK